MNPVTKSQWSKPLKTIRGENHLKKSSGVNHTNQGRKPPQKIQWSKPLKSRGNNLIKTTGFDPHPSSYTMLRQKSRCYNGYGSYAPLKMQQVSTTPISSNISPLQPHELLRHYVATLLRPNLSLRDNSKPKTSIRYRGYRSKLFSTLKYCVFNRSFTLQFHCNCLTLIKYWNYKGPWFPSYLFILEFWVSLFIGLSVTSKPFQTRNSIDGGLI